MRRAPSARSRRLDAAVRAALLALAIGLASSGCRPQAPAGEKPLETVEVTDQPDASANLETDQVAAKRSDEGAMAGALPADFPRDVPLPEPSSLVDFTPHGVTVEVQSGLADAKASYLALLKRRGFVPGSGGAGGAWTKGARTIGVTFADASGATRITIEIR